MVGVLYCIMWTVFTFHMHTLYSLCSASYAVQVDELSFVGIVSTFSSFGASLHLHEYRMDGIIIGTISMPCIILRSQ